MSIVDIFAAKLGKFKRRRKIVLGLTTSIGSLFFSGAYAQPLHIDKNERKPPTVSDSSSGASTATVTSKRTVSVIRIDENAMARAPAKVERNDPNGVTAASETTPAIVLTADTATNTPNAESKIPEPEMVQIDAGDFLMGASESDKDANTDERPQHKITIKHAFLISKREATFEQYDAYAKAENKQLPSDNGWGRDNRPVINVSWDDAHSYARWLSERTGKKYRLPTEAEWEYAAQGGFATHFPWGDYFFGNRANCNSCGSEWDNKQTAPVGSFEPNNYGLQDMAGNVWEWIEDCYHNNYENAPNDGSAWTAGDCKNRVFRGGSWYTPPGNLSVTHRVALSPQDVSGDIGFRLVRDP